MSLSRFLFSKLYARIDAHDELIKEINVGFKSKVEYYTNKEVNKPDADMHMECIKELHDVLVEKAIINPIQKIIDYGKDKI